METSLETELLLFYQESNQQNIPEQEQTKRQSTIEIASSSETALVGDQIHGCCNPIHSGNQQLATCPRLCLAGFYGGFGCVVTVDSDERSIVFELDLHSSLPSGISFAATRNPLVGEFGPLMVRYGPFIIKK
jgi:hypothetical protein